MSEIFVMYELDQLPAARSFTGRSPAEERPVLRVHAANAAPGSSTTPGPRTLCGQDTFAMEAASWKPSEHPGSSWYTPKYARLVCAECDAVMEV
ncbi:hypothetical protein OG729_24750 [Streptomyces sp. NBC_00210]|uniref:hypothetical protein n=1 Tax=unclassified Streptomyces TaxID=2593676 RepID=UPI00324D7B57